MTDPTPTRGEIRRQADRVRESQRQVDELLAYTFRRIASTAQRAAASTCDDYALAPPVDLTRRQDAAVRPLETPAGADAGTEAPESETGAQAGAERRKVYAAAIYAGCSGLGVTEFEAGEYADAAMAVADTELAAQRHDMGEAWAEVARLRSALHEALTLAPDDVSRAVGHRAALVIENDRLRAERDRARRVAVALEQQAAAVAALHIYNVDADYCELCADHGDIEWPCSTVHALNQEEAP